MSAEAPPQAMEQLKILLTAPAAAEAGERARAATHPGGVLLGLNEEGAARLCAGYLPCGACAPCGAAAHLSCLAPIRPGLEPTPGGAASAVALPGRFLARPLNMEDPSTSLAGPLALLALAGPTYQAAVLAGAVPGDTVLLFGLQDPAALPARLLETMGLRPSLQRAGQQPEPPPGRSHILDLNPGAASLAAWLPLAGQVLTCTLAAPASAPMPPTDLGVLLAGQTPARWVKDLHPHLALDLLALAKQMDLEGAAEVCKPEELEEKLAAADPHSASPWPVAINT